MLLFLLRHAPLEDWQQDMLAIVRDEAYYFSPQAMTKVMNEGWAVYWHSKLMTQHFVEAKEIIQYADQHSGVLAMAPGGFNPYKIGYELFRTSSGAGTRGQHGAKWENLEGIGAKEGFDDKSDEGPREDLRGAAHLQRCAVHRRVSHARVRRAAQHVPVPARPADGRDSRSCSRDFDRIKQTLLYRLTNMGQPFIYVVDANYRNRGELYLAHQFNGLEVDMAKAREVLRNVRTIWGRPVHLQMRIDDDQYLLSCEDLNPTGGTDGIKKEKINASTPPPAHVIE